LTGHPPATLRLDLQIEDLQEYFDKGTLLRGMQYAHGGNRARVVSLDNDPPSGRLFISGSVRGSKKHPYATKALLSYDASSGKVRDIDGGCSCPVGRNCKHIVALLITALSEEGGIRPDRFAVPAGSPAETPPIAPSPATLAWLDALDPPVSPPGTVLTGDFRVAYQLDPGRGVMLVGKSRCLKRGGLGKPAPWMPYSHDLRRPGRDDMLAEDLPVLRLALACSESERYYSRELIASLQGETGHMLLRQAVHTGRLFLVGQMEQPLRITDPLSVRLQWQRDSNVDGSLQRLSYVLPAEWLLLPTWPPLACNGNAGLVAPLDFGLPEDLVRHLLTAPPLADIDAFMVRHRLGQLAGERALDVPLPEADEPEAATRPTARLLLKPGRIRHQQMRTMVDEIALAELWFDYAGLPALAGEDNPPALFSVRDGTGLRTLARDVDYEREVWSLVTDIGLDSLSHRLPSHVRVDSDAAALVPLLHSANGWLPILAEGLPELAAAGIEVQIDDAFPYHLAAPEDWFIALDEEAPESGGDWFTLDLGVTINGERVSLVPPLTRLIAEQPNLIARLKTMGDDEHLPVAIDAQRIVPLPVPRLRAWLLPLLEFLDDTSRDGRPRLSRHHAAVLALLDEQPAHWLGGERLRRIGARLRDFSGIAAVPPAPTFRAELRQYQQAGLNWLQFLREYGLAGILADDMGLGKTVQTLAHLQVEKHAGRADRPSLVIAPTSLMANWKNEAAQFTPDLKVLVLHGPDRAQLHDRIGASDIVLTTYPLLVRDQARLLAQPFHLLVLDEAQFIKNPKAKAHQVARQLNARHRLSLTGTPLENHLGELWAQFDFLMPGFLGRAERFARVFRTPIEKQHDPDVRRNLAERVRPFLLRRTKEQVLTELPPRTEIVRWVEIEGGQRDIYESLRIAFDKKLRQVLREKGVGQSQIMILDALLKLRQVCCDPRLVKLDSARKIVAKGHAASAKLELLMEMLEELLDEGRKILLFSQFTSMLGLIEDEVKKARIPYVKLTGQTRDRVTPIDNFQNGVVPLFLISLKAGGTGLNLTAADTVIHYDPWWNPAVEEQATARAHRMGQDKPVFVYKLMTQGTVEEKILALQSRKKGLADLLVKGDAASKHLISAEDLDVLFQPLD